MNLIILLIGMILAGTNPATATVSGRIVDTSGMPISYATIYPESDPVVGTASNADGYFSFETTLPASSVIVISFIGYEKHQHPISFFADTPTIVLRDQPIALEETVVSAKPSRQKNKRKQMAYLLHQVMMQMESDFSKDPCECRIVSDVRMNSEGEAWGMEQMIARIVTLPDAGRYGDSIQFAGQYCKRYFKSEIRQLADSILGSSTLENMTGKRPRKQRNMPSYRDMAAAVDSGVVVHRSLWAVGNIRKDFFDQMNHINRWSVDRENDGETVLTYAEKHNYLGIFKIDEKHHYIVDSETLSARRYSCQIEVWVNIPFGVKLDANQLQMLNLLNMSDSEIEKFRLKEMHGVLHLNSIYSAREGHLFPLEKNLKASGNLIGSRKTNKNLDIDLTATQRATSVRTKGVQPLTKGQITQRVKRQIVEIY